MGNRTRTGTRGEAPTLEPNRNQALISAYKLSLRRRNLSPTTIDRRRRLLAAFARTHDLLAATAEDIEVWIQSHGVVARSRNAYLADLKSFYDWLRRKGHRPDNPIEEIERSKVPRLLPRPIPDRDLQVALESATPRMRLWLTLAAYAGLRCCEIASLAAEDLVWHHVPPLILVRQGKGGHQRMIPMAELVEAAVRENDLARSGFLFRYRVGSDHITAQSVSQLVGRYLRDLDIHASAHMLRHYFASRVYEETNDIRITQESMGHASPSTTAIYTAWSPSRAATAIRTLGPRPEVPSPA